MSPAMGAEKMDISVGEQMRAWCPDRPPSSTSCSDGSHFVCSRQAGCCMDQKMRRATARSGMSRRSEAERSLPRAAYKHECMRQHRGSTIWRRTSQRPAPKISLWGEEGFSSWIDRKRRRVIVAVRLRTSVLNSGQESMH